MNKTAKFLAFGAAAATAAGALATGGIAGAAPGAPPEAPAKHVLLLSVDGMHQSDLDWYVASHPGSALAKLVSAGSEFTNASTPAPSDSFPGMVGQVTGGNPRSTGVYYDDSWNKALLPAGTTSCSGATPGVEVTYFEQLDKDPTALDAGQGLPGLPDSILEMTGNPTTLIDPTQLPVDPSTCRPVYPNDYLKVNTVFGVAHAAGLRTAWSDKHAAYQILNGPGSTANIDDLFTPEINSDAPRAGSSIDWTKDNLLTQRYDSYKVQAVLNEINGYDHSGQTKVGTPALFGMNFQTVSTAQKLFSSPTEGTADPQPGGYTDGGATPGPVVQNALDFVNIKVGAMVGALRAQHLDGGTTIILSAKHGQSPLDTAQLRRIDDGAIVSAINNAWQSGHPANASLVSFSVNDDGMLLWLSDPAGTGFVRGWLMGHSAPGMTYGGATVTVPHSGLVSVLDGPKFFGTSATDSRVPDLIGQAAVGTVYTHLNPKGKIAEHGGINPGDQHVPLVVSGAAAPSAVNSAAFETTSIAPTILALLGLNPNALQAVQAEGTPVLPLG